MQPLHAKMLDCILLGDKFLRGQRTTFPGKC
jgi:hypothetical protein